jgi:hypothetical protein
MEGEMGVLRRGLSDKQALFVAHYVACGMNAANAARLAGYGGNSLSLGFIGYRNLKNPKIRAALADLLAEHGMQPAEIMARLSEQARGDMADFLTFDAQPDQPVLPGMPAPPRPVTLDLAKANELGRLPLIKKLNVRRGAGQWGPAVEIELYSSQEALKILVRLYSMLREQVEHSGQVAAVQIYLPDNGRGDGPGCQGDGVTG